jgi:hypothetical protein
MQRWSEAAAVGTRSGAGPLWTSRAAAQRSGDVVEHAKGRGAAVDWPMRRSGGARPPQSARAAAMVYIIDKIYLSVVRDKRKNRNIGYIGILSVINNFFRVKFRQKISFFT